MLRPLRLLFVLAVRLFRSRRDLVLEKLALHHAAHAEEYPVMAE